MTPTFLGRLHTRCFLIAAVGVPWTLLVSPLLRPSGDLRDLIALLLEALFWFLVVGVAVWEPIYHGLQQFRWEKDWPTGFGLITFVNEAIVVWLLLGRPEGAATTFLVHSGTTWLLMWAAAHGPMRVVFIRWRYRGGRLTERASW